VTNVILPRFFCKIPVTKVVTGRDKGVTRGRPKVEGRKDRRERTRTSNVQLPTLNVEPGRRGPRSNDQTAETRRRRENGRNFNNKERKGHEEEKKA
jgi:hypothetical protein